MKKNWLIAEYKSNQVKRVERNLLIQEFEYYLPKITIKKNNLNPVKEILFPGYIFVHSSPEDYIAIKYTKGIKNIIQFGKSISYISIDEIQSMQMAEEKSKKNPICPQIQIGQDAFISEGSLKGSMVKICSLPSKERVDVLFTFLGSLRRATIPTKDLSFY
jgi:transcription antitermination factor NusG